MDILEKYFDKIGGKNVWQNLKTAKLQFKRVQSEDGVHDLPDTFTAYYDLENNRYRYETYWNDKPFITIGNEGKEKQFFRESDNAPIQIMKPELALGNAGKLDSHLIAYRLNKLNWQKIIHVGRERQLGYWYEKFKILDENIFLYFNTQSALLEVEQEVVADTQHTRIYRDYRQVGAFVVPFQVNSQGILVFEIEEDVIYESIELNITMKNELFNLKIA